MPLDLTPGGARAQGADGPRVVCHHLLECFTAADIRQAFVVLRDGKWDIPSYLCREPVTGLDIAYVAVTSTDSVPESLSCARPFVANSRVAMGFPDVLFEPRDAFAHLARCQEESGCDVALGLFPCATPWMTDMVELGEEGRVVDIQIRPATSQLAFNWLLAVWGPRFTAFLSEAMVNPITGEKEFQLGTLFKQAAAEGMDLRGVPFPDGYFLDIGTPEGYGEALRRRSI